MSGKSKKELKKKARRAERKAAKLKEEKERKSMEDFEAQQERRLSGETDQSDMFARPIGFLATFNGDQRHDDRVVRDMDNIAYSTGAVRDMKYKSSLWGVKLKHEVPKMHRKRVKAESLRKQYNHALQATIRNILFRVKRKGI